MPRRKCRRRINFSPNCLYFKPAGIGLRELEEVVLFADEIEALRLKDFQGLEQIECSQKMNISQPTFHRILLSARKKVSDSLVNGKSIRIQKLEKLEK